MSPRLWTRRDRRLRTGHHPIAQFCLTITGTAIHVTEDDVTTRCGRPVDTSMYLTADGIAYHWPPCRKCLDVNE